MDKISLETKLSASGPSSKDEPTLVLIPYIPISSIQNNPPTHFPSLSLSYKFPSFSPTLGFKKPIVEVDGINSDAEI